MDISRLNQAGLKATRPRLRVLEVFESSAPRHLSAEEVYQRVLAAGADVGVASVYRILAQLEAAGLVRRHNCDGAAAVFEMNDGQRHDHLVCVQCGHVEEFEDEVIEKRQIEKAKELGFKLQAHSLIMYGICADCSKKNAPKRKNS